MWIRSLKITVFTAEGDTVSEYKIVRCIGGPADGQWVKVNTPLFDWAIVPEFTGSPMDEPFNATYETVTYRVHKIKGRYSITINYFAKLDASP